MKAVDRESASVPAELLVDANKPEEIQRPSTRRPIDDMSNTAEGKRPKLIITDND